MTKYSRSEKVDYLSFSFVLPKPSVPDRNYYNSVWYWLAKSFLNTTKIFDTFDWEVGGGMRPYNASWSTEGIKVFFSEKMEYGLVQISGRGCDRLSEIDCLWYVISETQDRVTRIDFAVDIEVGKENRAKKFIDAGYSKRFKSSGHMVSEDGETYYIGSRKSELFCRVYQYNEPHPRHELLRVEFEVKGDNAKRIVQGYLGSGLTSTINSVSAKYEFESQLWQPENHIMAVIPPPIGTKSDNDTIGWFYKQVRPAFVRLVNEGIIDNPSQFLNDCFVEALHE